MWAAAERLSIEPMPPPGYSPDLMPVEAMWRWLHEDVIYHHRHATAGDSTRRVAAFEANVNQDPCAAADRLWVKNHLDPDEEELPLWWPAAAVEAGRIRAVLRQRGTKGEAFASPEGAGLRGILRPAVRGGVVRPARREAERAADGADRAFGPPVGEAEHRARGRRRRDGERRVPGLPPRPSLAWAYLR